MDGASGLGMVTSVFAMNAAIEKAKTAGMAYVGVRNSCHFGAAGYYAILAAKAGMIGMAMANDYPSMAVLGAKKAVLGTNPFAYAVPAGEAGPDFFGHRLEYGRRRQSPHRADSRIKKCPKPGWSIPTACRRPIRSSIPPPAFLLPFAGHKGYGIALMIENLAGVLTGAGAMYDLHNWIDGTNRPCAPITAGRSWPSTSAPSRRLTHSRIAWIG